MRSLITRNTPLTALSIRLQTGFTAATSTLRTALAPLLPAPKYRISISHAVPENISVENPVDAAGLTRDQLFQFVDLLGNHRVPSKDLEAIFNPNNRDIISRVTVPVKNDDRAMVLLDSLKASLCQDTRISIVAL